MAVQAVAWMVAGLPLAGKTAVAGIVSASQVPTSAFFSGVLLELDQVRISMTSIVAGARHPAAFC
jgi:hypothetical protein